MPTCARYAICLGFLLLRSLAPAWCQPFGIQVVDKTTRRGVPLVELTTVNNVRYITDSNGFVAMDEPGLEGLRVFFHMKSHGYTFPRDLFGSFGSALQVKAGTVATVEAERVNIAERLYRITGEGIYRDTVLLGRKAPLRKPLLNAGVFGQDSVQAVPFGGRVYWFWGDTNLPQHPLGVFQSTGATSPLPGKDALDPDKAIDLTYFTGADGQARGVCDRAGNNPIWLEGLLTLRDGGSEKMLARYTRMKDLGTVLEHGLVLWDAKLERFVKHAPLDLADQVRCPRGHPVRWRDGGADCFLFPTPFATVRVRADLASLADQKQYEAFTCLAPGSKYVKGAAQVERDDAGRLVYGWKRDTDPITQAQERELIAAGLVKAEEARFQVTDAATGEPIEMHNGSMNWNAYRGKWILIAAQTGGKSSFLGEVWYAEADAPTGPWTTAVRILTHDRYTFYNPVHHAFLDQDGARLIFFEGTYANTFSGNPDQTPRYDYNQVMYRLDLSDPRLHPTRR